MGLGIATSKTSGGFKEFGAWRWMFVVGHGPRVADDPDPSPAQGTREAGRPRSWVGEPEGVAGVAKPTAGSISELFGDPRWRKNAIVGMILGFSGVVGLWGIGFFSFDLIRPVFEADMKSQRGLPRRRDQGAADLPRGLDLILVQNFGGFFGVYAFTLS